MMPLFRTAILCLTGITLISGLVACGEPAEEQKPVQQQPIQKKKKKKKEVVDIFAEPVRRLPSATSATAFNSAESLVRRSSSSFLLSSI